MVCVTIPDDPTKADKVVGATDGNIAALDASGNLTDSGTSLDDVAAAITVAVDDGLALKANIDSPTLTGTITLAGGQTKFQGSGIEIFEGINIALAVDQGTKFGTSTAQKLAFYNSTPIVQPTGNVSTALSNLGLVASPTIAQADVTGLTSALGLLAPLASPTFTGTVTVAAVTVGDGSNIVLGSTTGTKIGTATTQKLGFYNTTPVVQPTGNISTALSNLGLVASPTIAESDVTNLTSDLALKAPLASPTFTGTVTTAALTVGDGSNIVVGSTTGTKIGTSTTQKLGFYNSTPIVKPTGSALTALSNLGLVASPTIAGTDISTGTIADARLSSNVPLKDTANTFTLTQTYKNIDVNNSSGSTGGRLYTLNDGINNYPFFFIGGASTAVACVFERIISSASIYFGEVTDTGGTYFRGTGGLQTGGAVASGANNGLYVSNDATSATSNEVRMRVGPHNGYSSTSAPWFGAYNSGNDAGLTFGTYNSGNAEVGRIVPAGRWLIGSSTDDTVNKLQVTGTGIFTGSVTAAGLSVSDASNIVFGSTTGTKIGTSTTQKLAFYNSTPIVKPTGNVSTALTNLGLVASPTIAEADVTNLVSDLALKAPLAGPTFTGTLSAATITASANITATQQFINSTQTLSPSGAIAWNLNSGVATTITLGATNVFSAPTNMQAGGSYVLVVKQDATGGRTATWNAVFKWPGGSAPTLSTGISAVDIITFYSDGTNMYGVLSKDFA